MTFTVYALCEPDTGEIRCVGCTKTPLRKRVAMHVSAAGYVPIGDVQKWVHGLLVRGLRPLDVALERWPTPEEAGARESEIVADLRARGERLVNSIRSRPYTRGTANKRRRAWEPERVPSWEEPTSAARVA